MQKYGECIYDDLTIMIWYLIYFKLHLIFYIVSVEHYGIFSWIFSYFGAPKHPLKPNWRLSLETLISPTLGFH